MDPSLRAPPPPKQQGAKKQQRKKKKKKPKQTPPKVEQEQQIVSQQKEEEKKEEKPEQQEEEKKESEEKPEQQTTPIEESKKSEESGFIEAKSAKKKKKKQPGVGEETASPKAPLPKAAPPKNLPPSQVKTPKHQQQQQQKQAVKSKESKGGPQKEKIQPQPQVQPQPQPQPQPSSVPVSSSTPVPPSQEIRREKRKGDEKELGEEKRGPKTEKSNKNDYEVSNLPSRPQRTALNTPVKLLVNHFPFQCHLSKVYQYHVDVTPDLDRRKLKQSLLNRIQELGCYVFDGKMLFSQKKLGDFSTTVKDSRGFEFTVKLLLTRELEEKDIPLQFYNILFRQVLIGLKLRAIGRHNYDPSRPIKIPEHRLELWPGYITSINPTESGVTLIADLSHKIIRTDTVYDFLMDQMRKFKQNRAQVNGSLVGQVVLTRYNNRTYRIDDIAWDKTPKSKFQKKDNTEVSYMEYYAKAYNKNIRDAEQPLLLHKHRRRGQEPELIYLIPELCCMTGLYVSSILSFFFCFLLY
jgi:chemotaxis protein histidine kinase CheA